MRRYQGELVTAAAIIALAGWIFWDAHGLPSGGGLFPMFAAGSTIVLGLYWMASVVLRRSEESLHERLPFDWSYDNLKPMVVFALTLGYVASIDILGYFATTTLFILVTSIALGMRRARSIVVTLVVLLPVMYAFFVMFLGAQLPRGLLI